LASTSVSGPGQNAAASFSAAPVKTPAARAASAPATCDQRIEGQPPRPHRGAQWPRHYRIGAEPVDRFGWERDQPAGRKAARRRVNRLVVGRQNACSGLGSHRFSQACL
jgi:hypothetical protein